MQEINFDQLDSVTGGYWDWGDIGFSIGYNIGAAGGYIYSNIIVGNGVVDDIANTLGE